MMKNITSFTLTVISSMLITACTAIAMPTEQQHEALLTHNQLRQRHVAPNLQWDAELARYAAEYASRCQFKHSHGSYGENLAAGFPSVATAIEAWYGEHKAYSYQRPGYSSGTGHFTQIIWKSSTKIGCGSAPCNGKNGTPGDFLVCEYSPAGNIINRGYFKQNVTAPKA